MMTFILRSCMKNYTYALLSLAYCIRFRRTTSDSKFINFRRFPTLYIYIYICVCVCVCVCVCAYVLYCNWWDGGVAKQRWWGVRGPEGSLPTVWGWNKLLVSHTVFLYETFHYYGHTNAGASRAGATLSLYIHAISSWVLCIRHRPRPTKTLFLFIWYAVLHSAMRHHQT
jgi:hypothetical protein